MGTAIRTIHDWLQTLTESCHAQMNRAAQGIGTLTESCLAKTKNAIHVCFRILTTSRHAVLVLFLSCVFLSLVDIRCILNDNNSIGWWFMHVILFGFFYLFLQPWVRSFSQPFTGKPSYIYEWYASWLSVATAYHLPSSRSVMRMNPSLLLITFAFSILFLLVFHFIFEVLHYIFSRETGARKRPDIWTILKILGNILILSTVVSVACCVFARHCREKPIAKRNVKLINDWLPADSQDEISHVYGLWTGIIIIYIFNYVAKRLSTSGEERRSEFLDMVPWYSGYKPEFLDMVPWYSGTSADLYKTVFDLLVSVTVFVGRFDMRVLQAAMNRTQCGPTNGGQDGDSPCRSFSEEDELWFDFMADTGDGGNSTYTVAKLLAQPFIHANDSNLILPRGKLLIIGGDIAYPNPSKRTYEKRLFRPFEYALGKDNTEDNEPEAPQQIPKSKRNKKGKSKGHQGGNKPNRPKQLPSKDTPQCYIIPGNHDWFDGLDTFMGNICHKDWLGGWSMPQKKSYFALKLPQGWWVFGLDLALRGDIDVYQLEFFQKLVEREVRDDDSVILITHQPDWLLDWYENDDPKDNISYLICDIIKEKCKLRIAGDIHHYMRHSKVVSDGSTAPEGPHLLVNGCGGAFLHPTHVFQGFSEYNGVSYECKAQYPPFKTSSWLALENIWNFRKENGQFDYVGGIVYFILVFSMFPQCELDHMFQTDSIFYFLGSFWGTLSKAFVYMLDHSYVSLGGAMLLLAMTTAFAPSKLTWRTRIIIGILHVSAHLLVALILMLVLELGVEMLVRHNLLETSDYHSLYRWYQSKERYFPVSEGTRARIEQRTFGLYPSGIKYLLSAFDVPELMAVTRSNICKKGMESISRRAAIVYYGSVFLYFWVLSTPFVSMVFGSYLYICVNFFNLHYDEGFSSLRIPHYKAFTRFNIKSNGDLDVFTLGVDKVPEDWTLDEKWEYEQLIGNKLSHQRDYPSQWKAAYPYKDPTETVKIVDYFTIPGGSPSSSTRED